MGKYLKLFLRFKFEKKIIFRSKAVRNRTPPPSGYFGTFPNRNVLPMDHKEIPFLKVLFLKLGIQ